MGQQVLTDQVEVTPRPYLADEKLHSGYVGCWVSTVFAVSFGMTACM